MNEITHHLTSNVVVKLKGEILVSKNTPFQNMQIIKTKEFGNVLLLGPEKKLIVQFSEKDEKYYHESIVHPAMALSPSVEKILIIGGGDGGVLREVLKHPVKRVIVAELDKEVIDFCKENFDFSKKAFDDKRVSMHIGDGRAFLENTDERFDVIILDLTDPEGPSRFLFTKEFYELVKKRLNDDGVVTLQASSVTFDSQVLGRVHATLKEIFKNVMPYVAFVPSFFCVESFVVATDSEKKAIAEVLKDRNIQMKVYTPEELEEVVFEKSSFVTTIIKKHWDISTDKDPVRVTMILDS